jgi:triacylglycerol lipase
MPFDLDLTLNVLYPAANAAYLIMNGTNIGLSLPPGYTVVGQILADPQSAAHVMAQAPPDQQRIPNSMVAESNIFGLVARSPDGATAIVAIRGTKTVWEWIGDFDAAPVPWFSNPSAGLVHMGFQLTYEHICKSLRALLQGCNGVQKVFVTGHSLGGALAVLAAYDIVADILPAVHVEVYTFAGPRAGAPEFVGKFNALVPVRYRIVNFMDAVPQVPVPPLYQHVGTATEEVLVHGGFKPLDITYAHHLTTYLAGLQKLQQPAVAALTPIQAVDDEPAGFAYAAPPPMAAAAAAPGAPKGM